MEKYIDAMIRQNLMQRQAERKKVDEIDIRQFPELTVNWVSGHKLRTETVSNDPAALAECVMRHREDGELSIRSQDGVEVMCWGGTMLRLRKPIMAGRMWRCCSESTRPWRSSICMRRRNDGSSMKQTLQPLLRRRCERMGYDYGYPLLYCRRKRQ